MDISLKLAAMKLSPRQIEVVLLLMTGLTNKEIADQIGTKVQNVKFHLTGIFKKMKLRNRSQVIAWALFQKPSNGLKQKQQQGLEQAQAPDRI